MPRPTDEDPLVLRQRLDLQFRVIGVLADLDDGQVEPGLQDLGGEVAPVLDLDGDVEPRMTGGQTAEGPSQGEECGIDPGAHLQVADFDSAQEVDFVVQDLRAPNQPGGPGQDLLAEWGWDRSETSPVEEPESQGRLEGSHLTGERRLRQAESLRRRSEAPLLGDGEGVAQLGEVDHACQYRIEFATISQLTYMWDGRYHKNALRWSNFPLKLENAP